MKPENFDWIVSPNNIEVRKKRSFENLGYLHLLDAINTHKGDITADKLRESFRRGDINEQEFSELTLALLDSIESVSHHLAYVGVGLSRKVDELGTDTVTGLLKHELLKPELGQLLKELNPAVGVERRKHPLRGIMIAAIDVDNLKQWNSMHRSLGDEALQIISNSVRGVIKKNDYMFRRGDQSDEVLVISRVDDDTPDNILSTEFLPRIQKAANNGFIETNEKKLPVTAAVGYIILRPGESRSVEEILYAVDAQQQQDKQDEGVKENRIREAQERLR